MNAVIIFDVSGSKEAIVREKMRNMGYYTSWKSGENQIYLPRNVVWKPNTESEQAMADIRQAVTSLNSNGDSSFKLERCIVLNSTPWRALSGTP